MEKRVDDSGQPDGFALRLGLRRAELGLTVAEVARRSHLCPGDVERLEREGGGPPAAGTLYLLARALETTVDSLVSSCVEHAPGPGRANLSPVLRRLSRAESERHLRRGGIGRVVLVAGEYPAAFPVNFRYDGKMAIFRTAEDGIIARCAGDPVGFEVDRFNEVDSEGWSVLIGGRLARIDAWRVAPYARLGVEPWAGGHRDTFLCIVVSRISGRAVDTHPRGSQGD